MDYTTSIPYFGYIKENYHVYKEKQIVLIVNVIENGFVDCRILNGGRYIRRFPVSIIQTIFFDVFSRSYLSYFEFIDGILSDETYSAYRIALNHKLIDENLFCLLNNKGENLLLHASRISNKIVFSHLLSHLCDFFPFYLRNIDGNTILHLSIFEGNIDISRFILDSLFLFDNRVIIDEFINVQNALGKSALHLCVERFTRYNRVLLYLLLEIGALLIPDNQQCTPVHIICQNNDIESLIIIVKFYETFKITGKLQKSLMMPIELHGKIFIPASLTTQPEIIDAILRFCDVEKEISHKHGRILQFAVNSENVFLTQYLVDFGVKLNVIDGNELSPLKLSSMKGNYKIVLILLQSGSDPNFINHNNKAGISPLNCASQYGHLNIVNKLLDFGADIQSKLMSNSALHSAVFGGHSNIVYYLITKIGMDPNIKNSLGKTPLFYAILKGQLSCVKVLLLNGSNPDFFFNYKREYPIHISVKSGHKGILKLLLQFSATPDVTTLEGITPLMLCTLNDLEYLIPILISHGARISKFDLLGNTVLHYCSLNNALSCARYLTKLLEQMINISHNELIFNYRNNDSKTPFDISIELRNEEILIVFISYAKPDYFLNNAEILHVIYDFKMYHAFKAILSQFISKEEKLGIVCASCKFFDASIDGTYPENSSYPFLGKSLLHKFMDCSDQSLKYHPLVNIVVSKKLSIYRWWYVISLFFYLVFFFSLTYALISASYLCDELLSSYVGSEDWMRGICEIIVIIYFLIFIVNKIFEFLICWEQNIDDKFKLDNQNEIEYYVLLNNNENKSDYIFQSSICNPFILIKGINAIKGLLDIKFCYFFSSITIYFRGAYNYIDWTGILSLLLLIIVRFVSNQYYWPLVSLTTISFSLTLLKYTRIIPTLGAYVISVFNIFIKDIPRFLVIYVIILLAYFLGIHFSARSSVTTIDYSKYNLNSHFIKCNISRSNFIWFNKELTESYTLMRPLMSGIIFLLDGGPANFVSELLEINFLFTFLYLLFAFTIIVVMSNILIAQLSETYGEIIKENAFHYKIELVVTLELKSNLSYIFGKYFRKYTTLDMIKLSLNTWNQLESDSPNRDTEQVILGIDEKLSYSTDSIKLSLSKMNKSQEELFSKLDENCIILEDLYYNEN